MLTEQIRGFYVVLDVFSCRIVGWSMDSNRKTQLVCDTVSMAAANRGSRVAGVIHHSDHGAEGGFNRSSQHLDVGGVEVGDCGLEPDDEGCAGWTAPAVAC